MRLINSVLIPLLQSDSQLGLQLKRLQLQTLLMPPQIDDVHIATYI